MASRRRRGREGASGEEGADALGDAFHQVAQKLLEEAERRAQEALRLQEQRAAAALSEAVRQMEHKLHERDEAFRALRGEFSARMERVEKRMNEIEVRMVPSVRREGSEESGGQRVLEQLENRMQKLEASVQRALEQVFPRVEALVAQLEQPSSPRVKPAPPTPSATSSTSFHPPTTSAPGATATRGAAAGAREEAVAGHQGATPDEEKRAKERVELRIREVSARKDRARAAPSSLGEDLCKAVNEGGLGDVRRLLDSGADVNYINSYGQTPLENAVHRYEVNVYVVQLLLERGADVNAINAGGWSLLHYAASFDNTGRIVALLIGQGAHVDARDVNGATPLHCAARRDNEAAARALLAAGARRSLRCWKGIWRNKMPYDFARTDTLRDLLRLRQRT